MSIPNVIFIDTSMFDEQNYNFESSSLSSFIAAIKDQGFTLLLPDPTLREITRHIKERIMVFRGVLPSLKPGCTERVGLFQAFMQTFQCLVGWHNGAVCV